MTRRKPASRLTDSTGGSPPLRRSTVVVGTLMSVILIALMVMFLTRESPTGRDERSPVSAAAHPLRPDSTRDRWSSRAMSVASLFHRVYTPCWEGAYGALGDAYLFEATGDSMLLRFHLDENNLTRMCEGTWVDDRAWVCLAELKWWDATGRGNMSLVADAVFRYDQARREGRFSSHEGFWSWYNWPPGARVNERIFTNSNMNQMVTVACMLYDATGEKRFLEDALLAWHGDGRIPGIEKTFYRGEGVWEGKEGRAAFGKQLPWNGTGYCAVAAALFKVTQDDAYRRIAVATAVRIMNPATGWVDPVDFYQIRMDGNGAFVHFLLDAYEVAPDEMGGVLEKIETMLEHVWTNHHGRARLTLHRVSDHGIRNGWNPSGGEDGYGVGEVGTVHAQGEAARAFGTFAYFRQLREKQLAGD